MNKKYWLAPAIGLASFLTLAGIASAHAVVKPNEAGIGKFQTFTLGVPSEKPVATTAVRLVLPEGLNYVSPNVKPGWKIEVKKDGDVAKEISWTGGSIPQEQRDEFAFSAQVPAKPTSISWKVYQTYADGAIISWDQDPKLEQPKDASGKSDFSKVGPYSVTNVIDDVAAKTAADAADKSEKNRVKWALTLSVIALVFSLISMARAKKALKPNLPVQ